MSNSSPTMCVCARVRVCSKRTSFHIQCTICYMLVRLLGVTYNTYHWLSIETWIQDRTQGLWLNSQFWWIKEKKQHETYKSFNRHKYLDSRPRLGTDLCDIVAIFADQSTNQLFHNHHFWGHMINCKSGCPMVDLSMRTNISGAAQCRTCQH